MPTNTDPEVVLDDETIYLGDNGRALHGRCSGMSARYTGRDISGQEVFALTATEAAEHGIRCEGCER